MIGQQRTPYANNRIVIEGSSGAVEKHELYAEKTKGKKFMASLYAIHSGHFFGCNGRFIMMLVSLALPFFVITGWLMYLQRCTLKLQRECTRNAALIKVFPATLQQAGFFGIMDFRK